MKWIKPNGTEIELNDSPENIKAAEELGLVRAEQPTEEDDSSLDAPGDMMDESGEKDKDKVSEEEEQPDVEGGTYLYRRLPGEMVEGEEAPGEVILESELFPNELVDQKLSEGWYRTKEDAGNAPPDQPKGN